MRYANYDTELLAKGRNHFANFFVCLKSKRMCVCVCFEVKTNCCSYSSYLACVVYSLAPGAYACLLSSFLGLGGGSTLTAAFGAARTIGGGSVTTDKEGMGSVS